MLSRRDVPLAHKSTKRAFFLSFMVGLFALCLSPGRADTLALGLEELVALSDTIVTVRVEQTKPWVDGKMIVTYARSNVKDTIKGNLKSNDPLDMVYMGGEVGALSMVVPQIPQLVTGEEVVLFLSRPVESLTEAEKQGIRQDSRLAASHQVVGGTLGRFQLLSPDGTPNTKRKGTDPLPADLVVSRGGFNRPQGTGKSATDTTSYAEFRSAVAALVKAEKDKKAAKGAGDKITGIRGKYAVPEKSTDPVVRRFDPLPGFAYLTEKELSDLKKSIQAGIDARKAAENSKPAADGTSTIKAEEGQSK